MADLCDSAHWNLPCYLADTHRPENKSGSFEEDELHCHFDYGGNRESRFLMNLWIIIPEFMNLNLNGVMYVMYLSAMM